MRIKIQKVTNVLRNLEDHDFNKKDYSLEGLESVRRDITAKIRSDRNLKDFLKFLVHITALDEKFIRCGSNSIHLLVQMKVDLTN